MAGRGCSIRLAVRTARELPAPRVGAHLLQAPLRRPSEHLLCQAGIGPALGNIPGAARANSADDRAPAGLFKSLDDVENRISLAGPEIQSEHSRMPIEWVRTLPFDSPALNPYVNRSFFAHMYGQKRPPLEPIGGKPG